MTKLEFFSALPWTIVREEHEDDGRYVALRVQELPGFLVASSDEDELETEFWNALEAFLDSYLEAGEIPPLPDGLEIEFEGTKPPETIPVGHLEVGSSGRSASRIDPRLWFEGSVSEQLRFAQA